MDFFLSNFNLIPLIWHHCISYISILFLLSLESVFGILPSSIIENGTADLFFLTVNTNLSSYTGIILPIDAPHAIAWKAPMILPWCKNDTRYVILVKCAGIFKVKLIDIDQICRVIVIVWRGKNFLIVRYNYLTVNLTSISSTVSVIKTIN